MDIEKIKKAAEWADAQSVGTVGTPASRALWECIDEIERLKEELDIHVQAVGVSEWRRQECLRLRASLKDMLAFFGKPHRDEWMNEPAWKEACQVCENAKKILNEQITK